mgnify:CR=1 FL=1
MKIINKLPEYNESRHEELLNDQWNPLKEPQKVLTAILLSVPLMFLCALISTGIIKLFSDFSLSEYGWTDNTFTLTITIDFGIIFSLIILLIIHEFLHLIFIPNFLRSEKTYAGVMIFGGFVVSEEEISKARFICISLAPFILLSVLLPIILGLLGLLTPLLKFLIILNALGSSVDLLNLLLVWKQVPRDGLLISNGPKTYWKQQNG